MEKIRRTFGFIFNHQLGSRHPVKSFVRFAIWQLQSRFFPLKLIRKRFVGNVFFYARKGLTGVTGNIYTGLHEFNDMGFLLHLLDAQDTFFDIGANAGSYTLLAAGVRCCRCVALEPVASSFDVLSRNIGLNNLQQQVRLVNAAAGEFPGEILFTVDEDTTNHAVAAGELAESSMSVPVITIDSLLPEAIPSLIKMDVEGYETLVVRGMQETLKQEKLKAIIIELNGSGGRYGFDEQAIHQHLLSEGFTPVSYDPFTRKLTRQHAFGSFNTIYCRDIDDVQQTLIRAKAVSIMGEMI